MAAAGVQLTRPRRIATSSLGVIHLGLAVAYSRPALSVSPPLPGQIRVSVVNYINSLGPIWLIAFGLTGVALIALLVVAPRMLGWAHIAGVLVSATFSSALWAGFALTQPAPTIIAPVLSMTVVAWHIAMSDLYATGAAAASRHRRRST